MNRKATIIATGKTIGETVLSREDVARQCKLDEGEIQEQLSRAYPIRRRVSDPDKTTSDLLIEAGKMALKKAGISADRINLLLCVGGFPDYVSPAMAARVQYGLGASSAGFMDIQSGCAGFPMALSLGSSYLRCNDDIEYVMVVGGNLYSKFLHPTDFFSQLLFSDGAGAVILAPARDPAHGILAATFYGDGSYWSRWGIFAGGSWKGFSEEALKEGFQYFKVVQPYERGLHPKKWVPVIRETLQKTGWKPSDVDWAFLTQTRGNTIPAVCRELGWDLAKSYNTADKYGYLGPACIPAALDDAIENGVLIPGQRILLLASGVGYSCCSVSLVWGS